MKLLLIQPSQIVEGGKVYKAKRLMFPSLSLPIVAANSPPEIQIKIVDEYFEEIPFDNPADLVGISFMTPQAIRAYQIGDEFRKRGKKVVMGGIHASAIPEEALAHADAVVVGEAEGIWAKVIEDYNSGKMKGIYRSSQFPDLNGLPIPRYDLLEKSRYRLFKFNFPIQAGRGCPFNCEFCSVKNVFGGKYRWRPVEEVVQEIQKTNLKKIFFLDDNIIGNQAYARELFKGLIPLKLRWAGQAPITIAKDDEILNLASKSGCALLYIGLETISGSNLPAYGKTFFRTEETTELLKKIRNNGILIRASIIFGLENDNPDVFKKTVDFLLKEKVAYADFNILTPMPGTELRRKLEEQNRLVDYDWSKYDGLHVVYEPARMSKEVLQAGLWEAYQEFYSIFNILKRIFLMEKHNGAVRTFFSNLLYRKIARRKRHPLCGE